MFICPYGLLVSSQAYNAQTEMDIVCTHFKPILSCHVFKGTVNLTILQLFCVIVALNLPESYKVSREQNLLSA